MWSSKLHEHLKPRTHLLIEPDIKAYEPFYKPLLEEKDSTYKLIPENGLLWSVLDSLGEHLPHQVPLERGDPRQNLPNDTLLFVANFGYQAGRKKYGGFKSIAHLMVHQLTSACRNHSTFQRYGLIRMLIWMGDREKAVITPKVIGQRTKYTLETEITYDSIVEVASLVEPSGNKKREDHLESERTFQVVKKMEKEGIKTPEGRAGRLQVEAERRLKGSQAKSLNKRPEKAFFARLEELKRQYAEGKFTKFVDGSDDSGRTPSRRKRTPEYEELLNLGTRNASTMREFEEIDAEIMEYMAILDRAKDIDKLRAKAAQKRKDEVEKLWEEFAEEIENKHGGNQRAQLFFRIDDRRAFYHDPPILIWDRRPYEPLLVHKGDFYPSQEELALLDFQPRAVEPIFRDAHNYDHFEFLVTSLNQSAKQSITTGLQSVAPGALDWLVPRCPSLTDVSRLGCPSMDMLRVRTLTQEHWKELLMAWLEWPFKPSDGQVLSRLGNVSEGEDEDDTVGAMGKET